MTNDSKDPANKPTPLKITPDIFIEVKTLVPDFPPLIPRSKDTCVA